MTNGHKPDYKTIMLFVAATSGVAGGGFAGFNALIPQQLNQSDHDTLIEIRAAQLTQATQISANKQAAEENADDIDDHARRLGLIEYRLDE